MLNYSFWKGKRVFLTGHTGFKGSWMCVLLSMLGAEVTGYALNPPTKPSMYEVVGVDKLVTSIIADIRDEESLNRAIIKSKPDIVIHMAAQPIVREAYNNPAETYSINVMGTVNIFEAVRKISTVRAILNVTTDKVYENKEWHWGYRENDSLGGYDPYSNSKACSELVTSAYRNSFFNLNNYEMHKVAVATVRAGNVIGGGDWAEDRLIPDCIRYSINEQPIIVRSPGSIRPWQHVLEPIVFYLLLCEKLVSDGIQYSSAWNIGPDAEGCITVGEVVTRVTRLWEGSSYRFEAIEGPHEAGLLKLDNSKAKSALGWSPVWDIESALNATVEWYSAWVNDKDMMSVTMKQIKQFINKSH